MKILKLIGFIILSIIMIVSCLVMIWGVFKWDGGMFIIYTIFTLGAVLIYMLCPLGSCLMLFGSNRLLIISGYILSLKSILTMRYVESSLPLVTHLDEGGSAMLTPTWVASTILIAGRVFLTTATLIFIIRMYQTRQKKISKDFCSR